MQQPLLSATKRSVFIKCLKCNREDVIALKEWESEKNITCPQCGKKEIVILHN